MWGRVLLMFPLVQIDLPLYTDYASLEWKLRFAIECARIPTRHFKFTYPIISTG